MNEFESDRFYENRFADTGTVEKTRELAEIQARNSHRIYWFSSHTWIILALLVAMLVATVFQSLTVWEGDLLPYYGTAILRSRDPDRSLRIAVESHEQTALLRAICFLNLLFVSFELVFRSLFLTFAGFRVKRSTCNATRLVIFVSFLAQLLAVIMRLNTLFLHTHWLTIAGLLLNLIVAILQLASIAEISDYYYEYQRALQLQFDQVAREVMKSANQEYYSQNDLLRSPIGAVAVVASSSKNKNS